MARPLQQLRPHVHQELDPFRQAVELGQQPHSSGFQRAAQRPLGIPARRRIAGTVEYVDRPVDIGAIHIEVTRQNAEEVAPACRVEAKIRPSQLRRARSGTHLASPAFQTGLHLETEPVGILARQMGTRRGADGLAGEGRYIAPCGPQVLDGTVEQRRRRLFFHGGR